MNLPNPTDLIETFAFLPDWEARYAYLIDLGRALPDIDPALKTDAVLVPGCTSRVWMVGERKMREPCHPGNAPPYTPPLQGVDGGGVIRDLPQNKELMKVPARAPTELGRDDNFYFHFHIASDAAIVQGLCAVLMVFVQDQSADVIRTIDIQAVFEKLNLAGNLSPNRRNGFFAMVARIKQLVG